MSLSEALGGTTIPSKPLPQPSPSNPTQPDEPMSQVFGEPQWIDAGQPSATPQEGDVHPFGQYQLQMSDTFSVDYNPHVVDSSSANDLTTFYDAGYLYNAYDPTHAPGMSSLMADYTATSTGWNDAIFSYPAPAPELATASPYPSTSVHSWTYEPTSSANHASTSISTSTAYTNPGYAQQPQASSSSFASKWGGYQDLERDNDPIVLDEISKEHKSITRQRERNRKTFRKQLREEALGPKPRKYKLCMHLPEDFGCLFPVTFANANKKPHKDLKYPRDKTKDKEIENRHIHYPNGVDYEDWGDLEPGKIYKVSRDADPTPEMILNGTWGRHEDIVIYVPRPFEYSEGPTFTVLCSYKGVPGPNVFKLAKDRLNAKDLDDYVGSWMDDNWYRYTNYCLAIQWPGYPKKLFKFNKGSVNIANGYRYTILHAVAKYLWKYMMDAKNGKMRYVKSPRTEDWQLKKQSHIASKVRLMAVNYYRHVFFPVIAIDVTRYEDTEDDTIAEDYLPDSDDEE